MREYEERNSTLHRMGFSSYADYLASPLWQAVRKKAIRRNGNCAVCREPATDVHHRSYSEAVLLGHDLSQLMPLCRTCHDLGEFDGGGTKMSPTQANGRIDRFARLMAASKPKPKPVRTIAPAHRMPDLASIRKQLKLDVPPTAIRRQKGEPRPRCVRCKRQMGQPAPSGVCDYCVRNLWLFRKRVHGF